MTVIDFRHFYPQAVFEDYVRRYMAYNANRDEESDQHEHLANAWLEGLQTFEDSLAKFIKAKADAGELSPVPYSQDRHMSWPDAWNRLSAGTQAEDGDATHVTMGMGLSVMGIVVEEPGPDFDIQAAYANLIERVNNGKGMRPDMVSHTCDRTGKRFQLRMCSGWRPELGIFVRGQGFQPLQEEAPTLSVQHYSIPAPSGEILVSDWFRIDAFTQALNQSKAPSIETLAGRWATTAHRASLGVASFFVSNTSPHIFEREGQVLFATEALDEDENEIPLSGKPHGRVYTDLWWVTLVDREVLTDIVAQTEGFESAQLQVAQYLKERAVKTLQVPAGSTLHLHYVDEMGLQKRFHCDAVNSEGATPLYAVISLEPLDWQAAPQQKKSHQP